MWQTPAPSAASTRSWGSGGGACTSWSTRSCWRTSPAISWLTWPTGWSLCPRVSATWPMMERPVLGGKPIGSSSSRWIWQHWCKKSLVWHQDHSFLNYFQMRLYISVNLKQYPLTFLLGFYVRPNICVHKSFWRRHVLEILSQKRFPGESDHQTMVDTIWAPALARWLMTLLWWLW